MADDVKVNKSYELPKLKTIHQLVDLKHEIEGRIQHMANDLDKNFLFRVIAFSLSGVCLVDLRCDTEDKNVSKQAKFACKLNAK